MKHNLHNLIFSLALVSGFNSAWAIDKIEIIVTSPNRNVEVLGPKFFEERLRPPQISENRSGIFRYVGETSTVSDERRQEWIDSCQNQVTRLRDCYKQMQRDAVKNSELLTQSQNIQSGK